MWWWYIVYPLCLCDRLGVIFLFGVTDGKAVVWIRYALSWAFSKLLTLSRPSCWTWHSRSYWLVMIKPSGRTYVNPIILLTLDELMRSVDDLLRVFRRKWRYILSLSFPCIFCICGTNTNYCCAIKVENYILSPFATILKTAKKPQVGLPYWWNIYIQNYIYSWPWKLSYSLSLSQAVKCPYLNRINLLSDVYFT